MIVQNSCSNVIESKQVQTNAEVLTISKSVRFLSMVFARKRLWAHFCYVRF